MTAKTPTGNRDKKGRFAKGNQVSQGRTKGSRNKVTQAALELMNGQLDQITKSLINAALEGDMTAIKIVLDKVIAPCRESPLPELTLPKVDNAADMPKITAAILDAVTSGELLPSQAQALANLVQTHSRALELTELEARITKLEQKKEI